MEVALGSDHGGFILKQQILKFLEQEQIAYHDYGVFSQEPCDYPDIALAVAEAVTGGDCSCGILICGTGIGVSIVANKVPGIRAALCHDTFSARMARSHNNANVLALGERVIGPGLAVEIVRVWLNTGFEGGRHGRRVDKIGSVERRFGRALE